MQSTACWPVFTEAGKIPIALQAGENSSATACATEVTQLAGTKATPTN